LYKLGLIDKVGKGKPRYKGEPEEFRKSLYAVIKRNLSHPAWWAPQISNVAITHKVSADEYRAEKKEKYGPRIKRYLKKYREKKAAMAPVAPPPEKIKEVEEAIKGVDLPPVEISGAGEVGPPEKISWWEEYKKSLEEKEAERLIPHYRKIVLLLPTGMIEEYLIPLNILFVPMEARRVGTNENPNLPFYMALYTEAYDYLVKKGILLVPEYFNKSKHKSAAKKLTREQLEETIKGYTNAIAVMNEFITKYPDKFPGNSLTYLKEFRDTLMSILDIYSAELAMRR
jgi:hypothetical protein